LEATFADALRDRLQPLVELVILEEHQAVEQRHAGGYVAPAVNILEGAVLVWAQGDVTGA
jgi:hypothetical protein